MTGTPRLLLATGMTSDGKSNLFALDKKTGERLGAVEIPGPTYTASRARLSLWEFTQVMRHGTDLKRASPTAAAGARSASGDALA